MNENQIDSALAQLKHAVVVPPLITDDDILNMRRRPLAPWLMLGLSLLVVGTWWLTTSLQQEHTDVVFVSSSDDATPFTLSSSPPSLTPPTPAPAVTLPAQKEHSRDSELDPRSILVLSLTDEELAEFGIRRVGDTVIVPIQSLVVEDVKIARTLGLDSLQLADTNALFHWTSRSFPTKVDNVVALSFDAEDLDHLSPIRVYSIKGQYIGPSSTIYPALVHKDLEDSLTSALFTSTPSLYTAIAPHSSSLAMVPSTSLSRDRKPILIQVLTPGSEHRTQIEFMPTEQVLRKLPQRFQNELAICYAPYHPAKPRKWNPVSEAKRPNITLKKFSGVVGQPFIELDSLALRELAIIRDEVGIRANFFGFTIDTMRSTLGNASRSHSPHPFVTQQMFMKKEPFEKQVLVNALSSMCEVHFRGAADSIVHIANMFTISSGMVTAKNDWLDQYPKAGAFVNDVLTALVWDRIPIDSLADYWVYHGNITVPVSRLFVGLHIATTWSTRPEWNGEERRLVQFNCYLPSQLVLDALPSAISSFLKPEFEALYASIEKELTMGEMCALLEKPSAFGLCSITDSTFRIDGIGPIPARESFTVFAHSATQMIATLKLISDDGRVVLERANITISQGANQIPIPIANENIPAGAYTVVLTTSEGTRMSRVLVQR